MIEARPLFDRNEFERQASRVHRALVELDRGAPAGMRAAALLSPRAAGDAPLVIGAADYMDEMKARAEQCLPPNVFVRQNACGPAGECDSSLRPAAIVLYNTGAILAAAAATMTSGSLQSQFKPEILQWATSDANALLVSVTTIKYGITNVDIGSGVGGRAFVPTQVSEGFRCPGPWLSVGQTVQIGVTAVAAVAAAYDLGINVLGFAPKT